MGQLVGFVVLTWNHKFKLAPCFNILADYHQCFHQMRKVEGRKLAYCWQLDKNDSSQSPPTTVFVVVMVFVSHCLEVSFLSFQQFEIWIVVGWLQGAWNSRNFSAMREIRAAMREIHATFSAMREIHASLREIHATFQRCAILVWPEGKRVTGEMFGCVR